MSSDTLLWPITRFAGRVRKHVRTRTGHRIKGVGFLLRRLAADHEFTACGYRWFLDHRIGSAYASLLSDAFEEQETVAFLRYLADQADFQFTFVDVGANIGEMVLPMATHAQVVRVIAFEPHPACAYALRRTLALNDAARAEVREVLIGDGTPQPYVIDESAAQLSGIRPGAAAGLTPSVRLDDALRDISGPLVLLIDVEGAELDVMRSAYMLISQHKPLLIFEYHAETAKRFSLDDVQAVIGSDYELLRLRPDGRLDRDLRDMWNCVAVGKASPFTQLLAPLRTDTFAD